MMDVAIVGTGLHPFGRFADKTAIEMGAFAIRAALAMQAEVARAFDGPANLRIRIGLNSGLVVIGDLGTASHREFTATGEALNVADRIQAEAPAGGVLVSHDTYRYVRGVFDVTPRPPVLLKGRAQPVQTYLVRRAKPRAFRNVTRGVAGGSASRTKRRDWRDVQPAPSCTPTTGSSMTCVVCTRMRAISALW